MRVRLEVIPDLLYGYYPAPASMSEKITFPVSPPFIPAGKQAVAVGAKQISFIYSGRMSGKYPIYVLDTECLK